MFRRLFTRGYKPDFLVSFSPSSFSPYSKREREAGWFQAGTRDSNLTQDADVHFRAL